jgi:uncharacterized membrane protein YGL010W
MGVITSMMPVDQLDCNGVKRKRAPTLENYFEDYALYHQTRGNQITHWIGIPSIVVSLLGILSHLGSGHWNVGVVFWVFGTAWYFLLDWKLAMPFSLVTLGFYLIGTLISPLGLGTLFIGGWIFQFIGHSLFEKKKPALLTNIRHILIGPLWLFAKIIE